jgi:hypothetical protein
VASLRAATVTNSCNVWTATCTHQLYTEDGAARWETMHGMFAIVWPHSRAGTNLVHNGVMRTANKAVRQSVSLPANLAAQVRTMARTRRLSANRMLVELIENGIEAEKRKQQEFFDLAERFRSATDAEEVKRLGDRMGRMIFGN